MQVPESPLPTRMKVPESACKALEGWLDRFKAAVGMNALGVGHAAPNEGEDWPGRGGAASAPGSSSSTGTS
eukprot:4756564-Alexandrium_andersonii.AAC.1